MGFAQCSLFSNREKLGDLIKTFTTSHVIQWGEGRSWGVGRGVIRVQWWDG